MGIRHLERLALLLPLCMVDPLSAQAVQWSVNLPSRFAPVPFSEDFDSNAGTIPGYMALTAVDAVSGLPSPDAWANVGQNAPMSFPSYSGGFNLELGLDPNATSVHDVQSAMVLGLDGAGMNGLNLDLFFVEFLDSFDPFDGIWLSSDGVNWYPVVWGWGETFGAWEENREIPLDRTPVDTSAPFYLMFAEESLFSYGALDGVGLDSIVVDDQSYPVFRIHHLIAGQTATFSFSRLAPNSVFRIAYSLSGPGPLPSPFGVVSLTPPIFGLASGQANGVGSGSLDVRVPAAASGLPFYSQLLEMPAGKLSNPLALVIQ